MKTKTRKDASGELLEVKMDDSGKFANEYIAILDEARDLAEEKDRISAQLVDALRAQGRTSIIVRGIRLEVDEVEAKVRIVAKKPRDKK